MKRIRISLNMAFFFLNLGVLTGCVTSNNNSDSTSCDTLPPYKEYIQSGMGARIGFDNGSETPILFALTPECVWQDQSNAYKIVQTSSTTVFWVVPSRTRNISPDARSVLLFESPKSMTNTITIQKQSMPTHMSCSEELQIPSSVGSDILNGKWRILDSCLYICISNRTNHALIMQLGSGVQIITEGWHTSDLGWKRKTSVLASNCSGNPLTVLQGNCMLDNGESSEQEGIVIAIPISTEEIDTQNVRICVECGLLDDRLTNLSDNGYLRNGETIWINCQKCNELNVSNCLPLAFKRRPLSLEKIKSVRIDSDENVSETASDRKNGG